MVDETRERAAYHEAGHYVVAEILYPESWRRAWVERTPEGVKGLTHPGVRAANHLVIVSWAGPLAQYMATDGWWPDLQRWWSDAIYYGGEGDLAEIEASIACWPQPRTRAMAMAREAARLLRRHWDRVEEVAQALLRDGEYTSARDVDEAA